MVLSLLLFLNCIVIYAAEEESTDQQDIVQIEETEDDQDSFSIEDTAVEEIDQDIDENDYLMNTETEDMLAQLNVLAAGNSAPTKMWVELSDMEEIIPKIEVFITQKSGTGSNTTYTGQLFLPGNMDLTKYHLFWDSDLQVTYAGTTYSNGGCPLPPADQTEKTFVFKNAGTTVATFKITTYQGSANVQPVFIEIDESEGNPTIEEMDGDPNHEITCTGNINIGGTWYILDKMKGRGNATWEDTRDKKPYNITLGKKINFPGVDSEKTKKWSFLAEGLDHSLLCNRSGYHLAYELGIGQDTVSADVWMNGEYQGCYTVTPKTDSFVTKDGYMIEQDNYLEKKTVAEGGDPQFTLDGLKEYNGNWSSVYNRITVKKMGDNLLKNDEGVVDDENPEVINAAAKKIQDWLQDAWDAIRSDDGFNDKGKYYTDYIDKESFAKMYLMHEYVKSFDVCAGSILFHRDGQGDADKLYAGPLWDLDNAMGSTYNNTQLGTQAADRRSGEGSFIPVIYEYKTSIYKTISKHPDFMEEVYLQYNKNKQYFDSLETDVQKMINDIRDSAKMNHIKVIELSKNNHKYTRQTTLGSGQYSQVYLKTTDSKTDWENYATNLKTYIHTRSLWFSNTYYVPITGLSLDKSSVNAVCGDIVQLTPVLAPANTGDRTATWSSSNEEVASVDENGLVTVQGLGTATITATIKEYTASCVIICDSHNWNTPIWNWSDDLSTATATFTCSKCEKTDILKAVVTQETVNNRITFTATVTHEGKVFTDTKIVDMKVRIASAQVGLKDQILVKFNLVLNNGSPEDYKVVYSLKDQTYQMPLSELEQDTDGRYGAIVPVVAKEMTEPINIWVVDGAGDIVSNKTAYSVETFCLNMIRNTEKPEDLKELCAAILNYGAYAQVKFNYHTEKLANRSLGEYGYSTAVPTATIPPSSVVADGKTEGITIESATLGLEEATVIRFTFKVEEGEDINQFSLVSNGQSLIPEYNANNDCYYIYIREIAAKNMDDSYTVEVRKGEEGTLSVTYSVLTYLYNKSTEGDAALQDLCRVMYFYHVTAKEYFAHH